MSREIIYLQGNDELTLTFGKKTKGSVTHACEMFSCERSSGWITLCRRHWSTICNSGCLYKIFKNAKSPLL